MGLGLVSLTVFPIHAAVLHQIFLSKDNPQSPLSIAAHLRCSECGGKSIVTSMAFDEPTGPQPIGPSNREWKEHVRRKRG